MMTLKKALALISIFFATQALAAPKEIIIQYTDAFMNALQQQVQLTAEQQKTLRPVLFNNLNAREDVIASYMGQKGMSTKMKIRDALEPINANMQSEAQGILTPDQFDAFKNVQSKNQEAVKARINQNF